MKRYTLNAGEKLHLKNYTVKFVDGRFKFLVSSNPHVSSNTLCGTRHSQHSISDWMKNRKEFPGSQCKKCEKKLKAKMEGARG